LHRWRRWILTCLNSSTGGLHPELMHRSHGSDAFTEHYV
jgi:hypothetical protein